MNIFLVILFIFVIRYCIYEGLRLVGLWMLFIFVGFVILFGVNIGIKLNFVGNELYKVVVVYFDKVSL